NRGSVSAVVPASTDYQRTSGRYVAESFLACFDCARRCVFHQCETRHAEPLGRQAIDLAHLGCGQDLHIRDDRRGVRECQKLGALSVWETIISEQMNRRLSLKIVSQTDK